MTVQRKVPPLPPADVHFDTRNATKPNEHYYKYLTESGSLMGEIRDNVNGLEEAITPVVPGSVTTATHTIAATATDVIFRGIAPCVVTLPSAGERPGRVLHFVTKTAHAVTSASANVVPLAGGAASTAILSGVAGRWARLKSNGTSWEIMAAG